MGPYNRHVTRWTAAALALLLLGGCDRGEQGTSATDADDDQPPRSGGTLYRRLDTDVATLNPVLATSRYDILVAPYLFSPIINLDGELRPTAGLAESWDISPDGRQFTFHLNPKARFSDGTPVLASDVVFTLRKIADPRSEALLVGAYFEQMDLSRTRPIDEHTVTVGFREPLASQLVQFATVYVLPEHVYGKGDFRTDYQSSTLGSGPYTLVRRIPGKEVILQRRRDYWGPAVHPDMVIFKVIGNNTTAWSAARVGQIDETIVPSDVWLRERNNPSLKRKLDFIRYYGLSYNYIAWNGRMPMFADKRVRRALGMSLDIASIINNLYGGTARVMNGHFTPDQWCYNPDVPMLAYDPDGAKKIFTSLGWLDTNGDGVLDKDGKPFRFDLMIWSGSTQGMAVAQLFQDSLKQVGIDMQIAVTDFTAGWQRILAGNYHAAYLSWDLDADPDPFQLFHSSQIPPRGQNVVFYSSPRADALIVAARRNLEIDRRAELYRELQAVLAEDQPYTWVNQPSIKWVVNRRVNGAKLGKGYGLFLWYPGEFDWWIASPAR
jgi:peptide/nickel transport system substrate-binding protein